MNEQDEERMWWMILSDAETQSTIVAAMETAEPTCIYDNISLTARMTLRDKFGINLDDVCYAAQEKILELYKEEEEKLNTIRGL
jgi:hypothetical protein